LAFLDAGWEEEARRAAKTAAVRARKIDEGRPDGLGDVNARLAQVMHRLRVPKQAIAHALTAIEVLAHRSGSSSAYEKPYVVLESIGANLAEILPPQDALHTILDAAMPKPESSAYISPALLGLFHGGPRSPWQARRR
jgi:hypothetical protein